MAIGLSLLREKRELNKTIRVCNDLQTYAAFVGIFAAEMDAISALYPLLSLPARST
jgi:hypothetical protein